MRIAYWTTACLAPQIEAVSKEVFDLAARFTDSRIFAVSPHLSITFSRRDRSAGLHPQLAVLLRLCAPLIERAVQLNHIYAEVSPWLFFKALTRRPIVLTIASEKGDADPELLSRCAVIVVQTEGMRRRLAALGMQENKLRLIYPGVDLSCFTPRLSWCAARRPSVLLATFPRTEQELESRGVWLLIEAARRHPAIDFHLIMRPWGSNNTAQAVVQQRVQEEGLANVHIVEGLQGRMDEMYRRHDFTVIPYTMADGGKECPRSLIESLACGVPVLISEVAPFAPFVARKDCGGVFPCSPDGLVSTLERVLGSYEKLSANAARVARDTFDLRRTLQEYGGIYDRLA